jgi:hypothetical protein
MLVRRQCASQTGRGRAAGHCQMREDGSMTTLSGAAEIGSRDGYLAVISTVRADGTIQSSLVNAGVLADPESGQDVVGFVTNGKAKLANMRVRPRITVTFRAGWQWAAVEGQARIIGPDDPAPGIDEERLRHPRRLGRVRPGDGRRAPGRRARHPGPRLQQPADLATPGPPRPCDGDPATAAPRRRPRDGGPATAAPRRARRSRGHKPHCNRHRSIVATQAPPGRGDRASGPAHVG